MTEPLITLPSFVTIVAPWESGKTTLVKFLIYEHVEEICGIVVFSNSADNTYEKDYQFVHKRFTWYVNAFVLYAYFMKGIISKKTLLNKI
jgi:predicted AAA+ superfamily ATPase